MTTRQSKWYAVKIRDGKDNETRFFIWRIRVRVRVVVVVRVRLKVKVRGWG